MGIIHIETFIIIITLTKLMSIYKSPQKSTLISMAELVEALSKPLTLCYKVWIQFSLSLSNQAPYTLSYQGGPQSYLINL